MAQSTPDSNYAAPGVTLPLNGNEDVLMIDTHQVVQCQLADLMAGLVTSKGGAATITGSKGSATATVLGALLTALKNLGLIVDSTTA